MGGPCPIEWNQPAGVDGSAEYVLRHEFALVPGDDLLRVGADTVVQLALADVPEPFMIGVMGIATVL